MKYFKLLKTKLFWKTLYTYIKFVFTGMKNNLDWKEIHKTAKYEAISIFAQPIIKAVSKSIFKGSSEETRKRMIAYFNMVGETIENTKKFTGEGF